MGVVTFSLYLSRPLRDDETLPVRRHRVVAGAGLKGEESDDKEEVSQR